ncbi:MAG: response regulator [Clostridia bacterium]|nr:response regulator [Clostridia bacterium]
MIVDDEEIVRLELKKAVDWAKLGFYIKIEARNGQEALEKLGEDSVDLVVSDVKMPKIDGIELYKELKDHAQCTCTIFLSGYSEFSYVRPALVLGAFDYILKPLEAEKVEEILIRAHQFLEEKTKEKKEKEALLKSIEHPPASYPIEGEKQLLTYVLRGDEKAKQVMEAILQELRDRNCDDDSIHQITLLLIANISKSVQKRHPFIIKFSNIEKLSVESAGYSVGFQELVINAKKQVGELLNIIRSFKLDQKDNVVMKACEYVLNNVERDITLRDISEQFFISRNYFCSLFKKETGENFLEYVTRAKMERAKILLREHNLKAYEVSSILGYKETAYFSKLFKRYSGYSPTEYRKHIPEDIFSAQR